MKNIEYNELDEFTKGYIACAIWSSTWPESGRPLDGDFSPQDLSQSALASIVKDCEAFQKDNADLLAQASADAARHGHDFWLTRNRHGAGFWDRGYGRVGDKLSAAAHAYGTSDLHPVEGKLEVS